MNICPIFGNILLEEVKETEQKTTSGILLPDSPQQQSQQKLGKVLATGKGEYIPAVAYADPKTKEAIIARIPMEIKVNDVVVFKSWGSTLLRFEGKEYLVINQKDVLATINK